MVPTKQNGILSVMIERFQSFGYGLDGKSPNLDRLCLPQKLLAIAFLALPINITPVADLDHHN